LGNIIKRERYGVDGVGEGLTMYGIKRVQLVASERVRSYGDILGKQKRLTGRHVFFKERTR
jgi:hypothetical protein